MDEYIKKADVLQILADNNYTDEITLDLYDKIVRDVNKLKVKSRPRRRKGQWIGTEYVGQVISDTQTKYEKERDCTDKIVRLAKEIVRTYREYNPNGNYLDICFLGEGKTEVPILRINNNYWDDSFKLRQTEVVEQMDWIRLIKAMLIGILAIGNIWILINIFDSDVYAYIFLAECLIAIFIFIVWIAYHAIG